MKTYQKPVTELIKISVESIMKLGSSIEKNGQDLGDAPTTTETSGNLSRRSVWDDEEYLEEEEY